jgi:hypothetical protein
MDQDVLDGLWPIELCDDDATKRTLLTFTYRGETITKSFVAEMALSAKSTCRKCNKHIAFNEFRIGALRWLPNIGQVARFYHSSCFKRPSNLTCLGDVKVMDSLTTRAELELQSILQQEPAKKRQKRKLTKKEAPNSP